MKSFNLDQTFKISFASPPSAFPPNEEQQFFGGATGSIVIVSAYKVNLESTKV